MLDSPRWRQWLLQKPPIGERRQEITSMCLLASQLSGTEVSEQQREQPTWPKNTWVSHPKILSRSYWTKSSHSFLPELYLKNLVGNKCSHLVLPFAWICDWPHSVCCRTCCWKQGQRLLFWFSLPTIAARSLFQTVVWSTIDDGSAWRLVYSMQTDTATVIGYMVIPMINSTQTTQANNTYKGSTASMQYLLLIKYTEEKIRWKIKKWSKEVLWGPLPWSTGDEGCYHFTKEILELAPFAKVFATRPRYPNSNQCCTYNHSGLLTKNGNLKVFNIFALSRNKKLVSEPKNMI